MLNSHKLLYILPDVAYVTELLPAKKPNTFSIQSFRQINGEFMDDDIFKAKNIIKLFSKLEEGEYHLVLPDFLFTNTILNVTETSDAKVKEYINEKLLPKLDLSKETHDLQTFVLTEFKGVSKVQLSAIEKSVLAPVRVASNKNKVEITGLSPLSWTIKSEVSLEPSITVLQIGTQLYTALQYIGVDQATITPVTDTEAVAETIKTLRGAEPSIQTVYLLTNSKVELELKELVSKTLPLQQLTTTKEEDTKMPSYVKQIVESGMRTLSIEDYPVPKFELGKATKEEITEFSTSGVDEDLDDDEDLLDVDEKTDVKANVTDEDSDVPEENEAKTDVELPAPILPSVIADTSSVGVATSTITTGGTGVTEISSDDVPQSTEPESKTTSEENLDKEVPENVKEAKKGEIMTEETKTVAEDEPIKFAPITSVRPELTAESKDEDIDLTQFASHTSSTNEDPPVDTSVIKTDEIIQPKKKDIIKNSSGIGNMLKMVFITLAVFAITVAIGVGAGLTLISMQANKKVEPTPTPIAQDSATPAPSIEPTTTTTASPSAAINLEEIKVLIVNATTKAGYAGTFKSSLDKAGYGQVSAANAKGEYKEGMFVLMPEEKADLISQIAKDSELELEFADGYLTEDPQKQYDAVIVLAK